MNLDELRTVRRNERETDSLQHLRGSFYQDAADYIASLKAERERAADRADDPFSSPEVRRLTDEIETAEEVVEAVYERRVGKVVKRASFAAADMATEDEGLTAEERRLFDDLVSRIRENRERVLATIAGESAAGNSRAGGTTEDAPESAASTGAVDTDEAAPPRDGDTDRRTEAPPDERPPDAGNLLADAMADHDTDAPATPPPDSADPGDGAVDRSRSDAPSAADGANPDLESGTTEHADSSGEPPETTDRSRGDGAGLERTTVRITRDVGSILCVDEREYDLESEDVVTLPAPNAGPLLERDAAERID